MQTELKTIDPDSYEFEILKTNGAILDTIDDIGSKISTAIKKKEEEYLQIQNVFIKRKEKELKEVLDQMHLKNALKARDYKDVSQMRDHIAELTRENIQMDDERNRHHKIV